MKYERDDHFLKNTIKNNILLPPERMLPMAVDFEERQRRRSALMRSVYDYTMGLLWLLAGAFFLIHERFGYDLKLDKTLTTIFGVAAVLYGLFRIYRGYKSHSLR